MLQNEIGNFSPDQETLHFLSFNQDLKIYKRCDQLLIEMYTRFDEPLIKVYLIYLRFDLPLIYSKWYNNHTMYVCMYVCMYVLRSSLSSIISFECYTMK
jgi:hypothetical protein